MVRICPCCGKEIKHGNPHKEIWPEMIIVHEICAKEMDRRMFEIKCTYCGEDKEQNEHYEKCDEDVYKGYPGPN